LIFREFVETGFIRNLNLVEYSDANSLAELLPQDLLNRSRPLNNVVGFGINNLILIAFDYNEVVSKFEVNILKALTIKIDLMRNVKQSMKDVEGAFVYAMNAIARAAEGKDDLTGHHIKRVNLFTKILAQELQLGIEITSQLEIAAQMHDVGKIYIDDQILSKPGKLTPEEFEEMKRHTHYGQLIIGDSKHLQLANEIARSHHEKYDGTGYPDGKKGEEIPMSARIVALADVYDALRSKRTYKPAFTHQQTYDIIVIGDGRVEPTHFDPIVLEAFKKTHFLFDTLYNQFADI
ncbi:MAG: HD domain-containing protein, partial [Vallitaleaceae bacterium]|nr:HD domain-containing protein [Vallitaleaceae bacterium]